MNNKLVFYGAASICIAPIIYFALYFPGKLTFHSEIVYGTSTILNDSVIVERAFNPKVEIIQLNISSKFEEVQEESLQKAPRDGMVGNA